MEGGNPNTPGNETSEWTLVKWLMWGSGLLFTALSGIMASGVVQNTTASAVIGVIIMVLGAITGKAAGDYIKGRASIKAAKATGVDPTGG